MHHQNFQPPADAGGFFAAPAQAPRRYFTKLLKTGHSSATLACYNIDNKENAPPLKRQAARQVLIMQITVAAEAREIKKSLLEEIKREENLDTLWIIYDFITSLCQSR